MSSTKQILLPFASVKPRGWIYSLMMEDLTDGFVGHLDQLAPDLIIDDDIYSADRLSKLDKLKDVGTVTTGADWEVQFLWWNSETQSNWWDGFLRNVLLTENDSLQCKVDEYIETKLQSQDEDGYIGIYGTDLRFNHNSENGELWSQSSLLTGFLAYYQATGNTKVLDAVKSAVDLTMKHYPISSSNPFAVNEPMAGVCHGLTITDVLYSLYRITSDRKYADYAVFLFADYDKSEQPEKDIQTVSLNDPQYKFCGHGVHTYKNLRPLVIAAQYSNNERYNTALDNYLQRLEQVLTPSGAPIGDEWISGRIADPDTTGYEYCSIFELLYSYSIVLEKTNNPKWADRIEWLVYNAALGGRAPDNKSIAYCNTDNCYQMRGHLNVDNPQREERFKYSPSHQDVAVCCAPNAGRVFPYFMQNFASASPEGITIYLYGPSEIAANVDGFEVKITQETQYPSEFDVSLAIECETAIQFRLSLRRPQWATSFRVDVPFQEAEGFIHIEQIWNKHQTVNIEFMAKPKVENFDKNRVFVRYGPLLFVEPIPYKPLVIRHHNLSGFMDLHFKPQLDSMQNFVVHKDQAFELKKIGCNQKSCISDMSLVGRLIDADTGHEHEVELKPMAFSVLRKACFSIA